uniref:Uncharacterized protein n=1 Tax=Rhizophora mucronata TaxID=61149 RepID=A0A2P2K1I7_RHIMU
MLKGYTWTSITVFKISQKKCIQIPLRCCG